MPLLSAPAPPLSELLLPTPLISDEAVPLMLMVLPVPVVIEVLGLPVLLRDDVEPAPVFRPEFAVAVWLVPAVGLLADRLDPVEPPPAAAEPQPGFMLGLVAMLGLVVVPGVVELLDGPRLDPFVPEPGLDGLAPGAAPVLPTPVPPALDPPVPALEPDAPPAPPPAPPPPPPPPPPAATANETVPASSSAASIVT